jgi:hypothetical protein
MCIRIKQIPKAKLGLPISQCFLRFLIHQSLKFSGEKTLKKISNAEWAKIAAQAMKGKSVNLPDICAGNFHLRKFPISGQSIIED